MDHINQIVTTWSDGHSVTDFEYANFPHNSGLMMFDTQLWIDMGNEMQRFNYCGLFGTPTFSLIKSSKSVEYDGDETVNFSSSYQYEWDAYYNITKIVMTETEERFGSSTRAIELSREQKY